MKEDEQMPQVAEKSKMDDGNGNASDDDDLLSPTFLSFALNHNAQIATPEKVLTPANNEMSPITPLEGKRKKKRTTKFSVKKLLIEKTTHQEVDDKLTKMDEELKAGIEQGGILNMIKQRPADESQDLAEVSQTEDSQEDLLPQHQIELQKANEGFLNDFPDGFPGENAFIYQQTTETLCFPEILTDLLDIPNTRKSGSKNSEIDSFTKEILMSGFVVDMVTFQDIDDSVIDWLLTCICQSSDFDVIEGAFKAFWAIVTLKKTAKRDCKWEFPTSMFLKRLINMGACVDTLFGESNLRDEFKTYLTELNLDLDRLKKEKENFGIIDQIFALRFQTLLKCYTCCMKHFPEKYSVKDATCTVVVALRLCIALEIITASWEIQVLIGCAIDCYDEEQWKAEAENICCHAVEINKNHSNRLQMVEAIPITTRGRELKKTLALKLISIEYPCPDTHSKESQVGKVLQAVKTIHVHQETDYHRLFSTISLINYCLPDDSIAASDKKKLEKLITTLRCLNGEIRDPGGRFMNRTKVKDLIVRVISRLSYISRGLKTQSSLDQFFSESKTSFDELHFETLQDEPTKAVEPEEDCEVGNETGVQENENAKPSSLGSSPASIDDEDSDDSLGTSENPLIDLENKKEKGRI